MENSTIIAEDNDCDGVITVEDCDDSNMIMPNQDGDCDACFYSR